MDKRIANIINDRIQDAIKELDKYKGCEFVIRELSRVQACIEDLYFVWDKKGGE